MMDERVFRAKVGYPIPEWDIEHRLPLQGNVGPEIADSGIVFKVNSTYMDISDQPHMIRQWYAGGTLVACFMGLLFSYGTVLVLFTHSPRHMDAAAIFVIAMFVLSPLLLLGIAIRFDRDEFFWLRRRPIRFNRENSISPPEDLIDFAYLGVKYGDVLTSHPKIEQIKADLSTARLDWVAFRNYLDAANFFAFETV